MRFYFLICLLLVASLNAVAQILEAQEPLITDRPGQGTDAPYVLTPGEVQVEMGFLYQDDSNLDQTVILYPNTLVRIGVLERLELRASATLFQQGPRDETYVSPVTLGAKIDVSENRGLIPKSAVIINFTLPREGPEEVLNLAAQPEIRLLMNHGITSNFSITTNLSAAWINVEDVVTFPLHSYAASFDLGVTEYITTFAEFYGFWSRSDTSHLFNFGGTILLLPDLQLDLSGGLGLTKNAPNYFVSAGFSVRF
ncbi:MAG: transporter [Cyclobacteriaceae bacterium]